MKSNKTKFIFNEDACLWVSVSLERNILELEKVNYGKGFKKLSKTIFPIALSIVVGVTNVYALENNPFKVYKNGKELPQFFAVNDPRAIKPSSPNSSIVPLFLIFVSYLFQNSHQLEQNKVIEKVLEANQTLTLQNRMLTKNLLLSGGRIILAASLGMSGISMILLLRLSRSEEFQEKLKDFKSQQLWLFVVQLVVLAASIVIGDVKSLPTLINKLALKEKGKFFVENYLELTISSIGFGFLILCIVEYLVLPISFKMNPKLIDILNEYNIRLNHLKIDKSLTLWEKKIKLLQLKALKDKALIKIASTAEILERTYYKKLRAGMRNEMSRLTGTLPKKKKTSTSQLDAFSSHLFSKVELPKKLREKIKLEVFKPSYFYKIHQSYRIKQNLLAITYFFIFSVFFKEIEPFIFGNESTPDLSKNDQGPDSL